MRQLVAISLAVLIVSLTLKDMMTYVHFLYNRADIVETLCVNRDKPERKCEGKCFLKKQIEEDHKEDAVIPNLLKEFSSNIVFLPTNNTSFTSVLFYVNNKQLIVYTDDEHSYNYSKDVFHPPQLN